MHADSHPMREIFFSLCKETDTPIALSAWLRFKYSHKEFLELDLPVGDYLEWDVDRFKRDYAVSVFLSKWKGLETDFDLEAVALSKFATSELQCKETNRRLRAERRAPSDGLISSRIYRAKRKIAKLLGPFSLHCIDTHFGWGPGATHDIPRARALVDAKLTTVPITVGGRAKELLQSVIQRDLHWSYSLLGSFPEGPWSFMPHVFEREDSCRVTTVPKNAKTNRVIAIEPTGNLYLQKGVGGYIRRRLKRVGVDLDDQGVNQSLASKALELDLATLDLKAASDSVSRELVYELLPYDWAALLDSLRSHYALMPNGERVVLEKFSSMGNGFTFELESLIFWALGSSVRDELTDRGVLAVYGDDIICQKAAATETVRTLEFVGFQVNEEKSFISGLFYESCGEHYFNGQNVTPVYQKETFQDVREFIRCHNRLVRWSQRVDVETTSFRAVKRSSPASLHHCCLPYGVEGDDGFLAEINDFLMNSRGFDPNRGFRVKVVKSRTRSLPGIEPALLAIYLREAFYSNAPTVGLVSSLRPDIDPTYGNVQIDAHRRKPVTEDSILFGWRWIIPPGYCPLPIR